MKKILNTKEIVRPLHAYPIICSIYTSIIITAIALAGKLTYFSIPMYGNVYIGVDFLIIPFVFFFQNVVTEVYGYERCRQLNQISIIGALIFVTFNLITSKLSIAGEISGQDAFNEVINTYPRHLLAFLFALYFGSIVNQYLISKLKVSWNGKSLWLRSIASTFIGDFTYQIIGSLISRYGILKLQEILSYDILAYSLKILFEVVSIPFVYAVSNYLKSLEGLDIYDRDVNYNPLKLSLD